MIVIAEHRDHWHRRAFELAREHLGFLEPPDIGEIARKEQRVGAVLQCRDVRPQRPASFLRHVYIADRCNPDHALRLTPHAFPSPSTSSTYTGHHEKSPDA
jgi:hypothetical protein